MDTQFTVCRAERVHGDGGGLGTEIDRQHSDGRLYEASNIDKNRSHLNKSLVNRDGRGGNSIVSAIDNRINTAGINRKVTNDQCRAMVVYLSGTHDQMMEIENSGRLDEWAEESVMWLKDTFGEDNVVVAELHLDEFTPHIHAVVVPVTKEARVRKKREGEVKRNIKPKTRLSADHFMKKVNMRKWQDTYAERMAHFGLQRGIKGSQNRHQSMNEYYKKLKDKDIPEAERSLKEKKLADKELDESIKGKKSIVAELDNDIENKENNKELLQMDVDYLTDERTKLQVEETELKQSIEQLSPIKESKEQTIAVIKEIGSKAIDAISGKGKREKEELNNQLRDEKKQHATDVAELKSQHENAVAELKTQHEDAIAKLKNKHKTELGKAKDELKEEKKEHVKTQKALDKALADNSQDELKRKLKEMQNELATARRNETVAKNKKADSEKTLRLKEMEHEDYMWLIDTCAKHNLPSNIIRPLIEGKEVDAEVHGETRRLKFQRREFYNRTASLLVKVKDMWQNFLSWYRQTAEQLKLKQSASVANTRKKGFGIG